MSIACPSKWRVVSVDKRTQHRHATSFVFTEEEAKEKAAEAAALPLTDAWAEAKETT